MSSTPGFYYTPGSLKVQLTVGAAVVALKAFCAEEGILGDVPGKLMQPELRRCVVKRSSAGVRAQAVTRAGQLVDDFLFLRDGLTLSVLNAPSPAATACLPFGEHIAQELCAM